MFFACLDVCQREYIYRDEKVVKFRGLEKNLKQHHLCRAHGILSSGLLLIYHALCLWITPNVNYSINNVNCSLQM